jgi:hypothetical protein
MEKGMTFRQKAFQDTSAKPTGDGGQTWTS